MKAGCIIILLLFLSGLRLSANPLNENSEILLITDGNTTASGLILEDAINAEYSVRTIVPDLIKPEMLEQSRLVILSTGNNSNPCSNFYMRNLLINYVLQNGKIIIEGGHNAAVTPMYPAFSNKVLKIQTYITDNGGEINLSTEFYQSDLANVPNTLTRTLRLNYENNFSQDVCINTEFSVSFCKTSNYPDKAGIIVAPSVSSPQIINFCFNYASLINRSDAKNLLTNSIYSLIGKSVGISLGDGIIPTEFELYQNYPNPFNPLTIVSYNVSKTSIVKLIITDVLGNEVKTLINEKHFPGKYSVSFEGNGLSSGAYFYLMYLDGNLFRSKRMILLK